MILLQSILNRLRGTGKLFWIINGNALYVAMIWVTIGLCYYFQVTGVLTFTVPFIDLYINLGTIETAVLVGFIAGALYAIGEASTWGKWVGSLTHPGTFKGTEQLDNAINEERGKKFPYIWHIANFIIKEDNGKEFNERLKQYIWHCRVALTLRGIYWWLPMYLFLGAVGLITVTEGLVIGLLLGFGFPIASELGRLWKFTFEWKFFHTSQGWCNQELIYGAFQGIAMWYVILG